MRQISRQNLILISLLLINIPLSTSQENAKSEQWDPATWKPGDRCPTEIRSGIPIVGWSEELFSRMDAVHAAMLTCPNISVLELYAQGGSPCFPPVRSVSFTFSESSAQVERWASAPEVLLLDDFSSDATGSTSGSSYARDYFRKSYPDSLWFDDWYSEYLSNLTSSNHASLKGQEGREEQIVLVGSRDEENTEVSGENKSYKNTPIVDDLKETGSNSPAASDGSSYIPDSTTPETETNFDVWLKVMDFSRIHTLKLGERAQWGGTYSLTPRLAETLPPHLTSLKKLELKNAIGAKFILNLPKNVSLTHLTWREPWGVPNIGVNIESLLMPVFEHHGSTLETLYLHSHDSGKSARPALSIYQLQGIVRHAPNIKKLTIDLRRPFIEDWPWDELKLLATDLPNLTDLTIYLDLAYAPCRTWPYTRQLHPTPGTPAHLPKVHTLPPGYHQMLFSSPTLLYDTGPPPTPIPRTPEPKYRSVNIVGVNDLNPSHQTKVEAGPTGAGSSEAETKIPQRSSSTTPTVSIPPPPPQPPLASMMFATSPAPSPCYATDKEWNKDCLGRDAYAQPMVNISQGEKIVNFLAKERAAVGGKPFERIRIRSGNEGWGVDGGFLTSNTIPGKYKWDWIDGKSTWVSCFGREWPRREEMVKNATIFMGAIAAMFEDHSERTELNREEFFRAGGGEFVCFAGENLEELREWEARCNTFGGLKWNLGKKKDGFAGGGAWLFKSEREE